MSSPPEESAEAVAPLDAVVHAPPSQAAWQRRAEANFAAPSKTEPCLARNSMWTIGGYAAGQVLRLAGNIVVSRLVLPEAFGLMAIVNVLIQGLTMFSDVGIEPVLVQNKRGDEPRFYNTAWTVQVVRGWLLFLSASLLAVPAAHLYDEPRLLYLLPVAAGVTVVAGFNSTALYAVRRHLLIGRLTLLELTAQVVGVAVMCGWAWVQPSVWAMIAGLAAQSAVTLVGSHLLLPNYRNRFAWDHSAFADLFHFGKWVFVSTLITFCAMQIDRLMLGRLITLDALGVYSVALAIAMMPNMLMQTLSGTVLYPLLSRVVRTSPSLLQAKLGECREILLSLGVFCTAGVVLEAPTFFSLLYDARYAAAGLLAQLLAVGVWVSIISNTLERALQALGDTRSLATYNLTKLVVGVAAALAGFSTFGLPGFILGYACGAACGHLVLLRCLKRRGISAWHEDVRMTALVALTIVLGQSLSTAAAAHGPIVREIAVWSYLALLGMWAVAQARRLRDLQA